LEHLTGENIGIQDVLGAATSTMTIGGVALGGATGTDSTLVEGQVTFHSNKSYSVVEGATSSGIVSATGGATVNSALDDVASIDISTQTGANDALKVLDEAIASIDTNRAALGAVQNRFESTIANLMNVSQNIAAARSRIVDADFAAETANLTKAQILQQAGIAMLAQANTIPQAALTLLQG
ncbi:MAG: flagellin, partial [Desulfobulbaceae bacterium]|nr:flagellin [Desulfobulbaceae bacterium]